MAVDHGKSAFENLKSFRARNWFPESFQKYAKRVAIDYAGRSEVSKGLLISEGTTVSGTSLEIDMTAGEAVIDGKLMSSAVFDSSSGVYNLALASQASIAITVSNVPTIGANSNTHEVMRITSGGNEATIRFYNSGASSPTGYDTTGSWTGQVDIDLNGLDAAAVALAIQDACNLVFTTALGYTVGTGAVFSVTAPVGSGNDFTYVEDDGAATPVATGSLGNMAAVPANYANNLGGLLFTTGAALTTVASGSNTYFLSVIASNSDQAGGANGDGGTICIHAVIDTDIYPTSKEITAALAASSGNVSGYDHSGATGWAHLGQIAWGDGVGATTVQTFAVNRNNAAKDN